MISAYHILEIASRLVEIGGEQTSRHLDEVCKSQTFDGMTLRYWVDVFYREMERELSRLGEERGFILTIPISVSSSLNLVSPKPELILTFEGPVPSLYVGYGLDPFIKAYEEYRVAITGLCSGSIFCIYRSWRDERSARMGWEFNNYVYVWSSAIDLP